MICYGWPEHEYQVLDTRNQKGYNTVYYTHTVASYKKQELLTFHNHRGSPPVLSGEPIAHSFCFLSYVMVFVVALFVFILCFVYPLFPLFLGGPFLIALCF
jgi:hypothetical protein